jgi:hypothetical protein
MPKLFFLSSLSHSSYSPPPNPSLPPFLLPSLPPSLPPHSLPFRTLSVNPSAPPGLGDYASGYGESRTFASPDYTNLPPSGHVEHPYAQQHSGASWMPTLKTHYQGSEPERAPVFEHVQASQEVRREDGGERREGGRAGGRKGGL